MIKLLDIGNLTKDDIYNIWRISSEGKTEHVQANIAWSFEGNGIRTRTTFLQAFKNLGISYVELPNFLKTGESVKDLAGYMDSFYSMYIIRENKHSNLAEFSKFTSKPVINAMSSEAHPCEVLADACYLNSKYESIRNIKILLWGPTTNVFKSWHSLANVLGLNITQFCPKSFHELKSEVTFTDYICGECDVVITDSWPSEFSDNNYSLSLSTLAKLGNPELLPTPPVTVGKEVLFELSEYARFSGYSQKKHLLTVQQALIFYMLKS